METAATLFSVVAAFAAFILLLDVLGSTFGKGDLARRKGIAAVIFPLMMVYCLTHTVQIGDMVVDPRYVPLTMAIFAGGWPALLTTMLTGIIVRYGIGGPNVMIAIVSFLIMSGISAVLYASFRASVRPMPIKLTLLLTAIVNSVMVLLFAFTTGGIAAMPQFMPQLVLVNILGMVSMGLHIRYIQQRNVLVERLEVESAQKSRFLGVMGHEMRSPLNAIVGYTYVVNDASSAKETREAMEKIRASSRHAVSMFENLLDATRLDAGAIKISRNTFNLRQFLNMIADQARPAIERKNIDFRLHIADEAPEYLKSDEFRLRQIIVNLVDNATKYTARGCVCVTVSMSGFRNTQLMIQVEDTGMGIASEDIATIFKPYQQTDRAETMRRAGVSGAGLGLSIVDGLVRTLKGKVSVTSTLNKGTTFTVTIPVEALTADEAGMVSASTSGTDASNVAKRPRVLVVDDDEANRKITAIHLEIGGYEFSTVENGAEALECLEKECFDLVLVDRYMPVMDGLAFSKAVRSHDRTGIRQIKLLLVTGADPNETGMEEISKLVDGQLRKPISYSSLGSVIDHHLSLDGVSEQDSGKIVTLQPTKKSN